MYSGSVVELIDSGAHRPKVKASVGQLSCGRNGSDSTLAEPKSTAMRAGSLQ